jgi:hypothetical protein
VQLAQVNQPLGVLVAGLEPGLVGQITVEVYDPVDGRTIVPATSGGISEPRSGSYYATLVVTVPGSFSVRWLPPTGVAVESEIVITDAPIPVPVDLRPTLAEVSNLLYDRIVKQGGHMGDVFDDETTPKGSQVEGTITMAVNQLVSRVDVAVKTDQVGQGRWLATLYASAMTALVFIPEQNSESPVYTGLMTEYGAQINDWIRANRYPLVPWIG